MQFEGKTVWVTGGRSGIGKAVAAAFADAGAQVVISTRSADELEETARDLGGAVHAVPCDVRDEEQIVSAVRHIADSIGVIDILINNAGASVFKDFDASTPEDFDLLMTTNLRGPFLCTRAVLPAMIERGSGIIVMINSMSALKVFPKSAVYGATKSGLKMLTDCLREEVRQAGIHVVSVFPGATYTEIWPEHALEKHGHRMMQPEDVASAVLNACSAPSHVMVEDVVLQPIGGGI